MKSFLVSALIAFLFLCQLSVSAQTTYYWVATGAGNWNNANNWSLASGGIGGAGPPISTTDIIVFDGVFVPSAGGLANGDCKLLAAQTVGSLSVSGYTGTIDLNGFNFAVQNANSNCTFQSGIIFSNTTTSNFTISSISPYKDIIFSGTRFESSVNLTAAGRIYLNGSFFNGVTVFNFDCNGAGVFDSNGGNTFKMTTTLNGGSGCDGANYPRLGNTTPDIFDGPLSLKGQIRLANNSANNQFNNTVTLLTGSNGDIYIGEGTNASATFGTNGNLVSVAATPYLGKLFLKRVTQTGTLANSLYFFITNSTRSSTLDIGTNCVFNGDLTFQGRNLSIDGTNTSFNANCIFDFGYQTGTLLTLINSPTFNGNASFISNKLTTNYPGYEFTGTFKGSFSYNRVGFADIILGWRDAALDAPVPCSFAGDVSITNSITQRILGYFIGGNNQTITSTGSSPTFLAFWMNKTPLSTGELLLSTPITIGNGVTAATATFTQGIVVSTSTNIPTFSASTSVTSMSNSSYVEGPVKKIGNTSFTFPVGKSGYYRPVSISAPSTATAAFTAEFIDGSAKSVGATYGTGIVSISECEYWTVQRNVGSSNPNVTISWEQPNSDKCLVNLPADLRVGQWSTATSQWVNRGGSGTGTTAGGQITSASTDFALAGDINFALSSSSLNNPLPIELVSFDGESIDYGVRLFWETSSEVNSDRFEIERAGAGLEFTQIGSIQSKANPTRVQNYEFIDRHPFTGENYYRLKQVDVDGASTFFEIINIDYEYKNELGIYPNPVLNSRKITINKKGNFLVVNSLGKVAMKVEQSDEFDAAGLMPGVYSLICDDRSSVRFIVK